VLGADVVVVQPPGLLLGEDEAAGGRAAEAFEHGGPSGRAEWLAIMCVESSASLPTVGPMRVCQSCADMAVGLSES
jgi:hypothetical protein